MAVFRFPDLIHRRPSASSADRSLLLESLNFSTFWLIVGPLLSLRRGPRGALEERELGPGDRVAKGQRLAIVWSSELSERKNALLETLSRLRLERETFDRINALHKEKVVSTRDFQEAKRELEQSAIEAARAERS